MITGLVHKIGGAFTDLMNKAGVSATALSRQMMVAGVAVTAAGGIMTAGAIGMVHGLDSLAMSSVRTGQAAYEMAQKYGLSMEQASAWASVSNDLNVNVEQMGTGFKFLGKNMEGLELLNNSAKMQQLEEQMHSTNAATAEQARAQIALTESSRPMQQAFDALNIQIRDANGNLRPLNDVMMDAADAFARMEDGPEKVGLAMKIFGRSGSDLIPVLNQGRAGLEAFMKTNKEAGVIMTEAQIKTAHEAFLKQKALDDAIAGVKLQLGTALIPALVRLMEVITPLIEKVTHWIEQHPKLASGILIAITAITGFMGIVMLIAGPIIALTGLIGVLSIVGVGGLMAALLPLLPIILIVIGVIIAVGIVVGLAILIWVKFHTQITGIVTGVWNFIKSHFLMIANFLRDPVPAAVSFLVTFITGHMDALKSFFAGVVKAWTNIGGQLVNGLWNGIKDNWSKITQGLGQLASKLPDPIKQFFHIKSPSRLMADEIGGPLIHGITQGITNAAPGALTAMWNAAHGLVSAASSGAQAATRAVPPLPSTHRIVAAAIRPAGASTVASGQAAGSTPVQSKVEDLLTQIRDILKSNGVKGTGSLSPTDVLAAFNHMVEAAQIQRNRGTRGAWVT